MVIGCQPALLFTYNPAKLIIPLTHARFDSAMAAAVLSWFRDITYNKLILCQK